MSNLLKTNTTVSDLIGKFQMGATRPTGENDVVGLQTGDTFINTTTKKLEVYDGSKWVSAILTTTSTSTS